MPDITHFSDSEESFHSFDDNEPSEPPTTTKSSTSTTKKYNIERFSPAEEASLLTESNALKTSANTLFATGSFENAIQTYDRALASCPTYLDYEIAVLRSNVAACHLKLEEWKEALESTTKGIECLERLEPLPKPKPAKPQGGGDGEGDDVLVEEVDPDLEDRIAALSASGHTLSEIRKLQTKLLMRRAKSRTSLSGWANLQAADEDYKILLSPSILPTLSPTDKRQIEESVRRLGPVLNESKDREMAEMMGKLKGLGNSLLGTFGLSTDNFKFVKDENTGGYSMNFDQNGGKTGK